MSEDHSGKDAAGPPSRPAADEVIGAWQDDLSAPSAAAARGGLQRLLPLAVAALGVIALGVMLTVALRDHGGAGASLPLAANAPATAPAAAPAAAPASKAPAGGDLGMMTERLAKRLKDKPDDPGGWELLARSYLQFGRHAEAADAFKQAYTHGANNPQFFSDYAETLATANGGKYAGEPAALLDKALKIDPKYPKALELSGTAAAEAGDYALAVRRWEALRATLAAGSPEAASLDKRIAEAKAKAAAKPAAKTGS